MAISIVQTIKFDDLTGSTSWTKSSISTTAGSTLIIAMGARSWSAAGVTAAAGNAWTVRASVINGGAVTILSAPNAAAITSYTINGNGISRMMSQFYEVSGAGAVDVTNTNTCSGTSVSSESSGTPAGAADLAIGIGGQNSGDATYSSGTFTSGAGTEVYHNSAVTAAENGATGSLILASATAQTYTVTTNVSASWSACVVLWSPVITVSVPDTATVTGSVSQMLESFVDKSDPSTVTDVPIVATDDMQISTSDGTTVTDVSTVQLVIEATVSDPTTATDTPSVTLLTFIDASDPLTATDASTVATDNLTVGKSDDTTVTDSSLVSIAGITALLILTNDDLTVLEAYSLLKSMAAIGFWEFFE